MTNSCVEGIGGPASGSAAGRSSSPVSLAVRLLNVRSLGRVNLRKIVFVDHAPVFAVDLSLEYSEALVRVLRITHVHAGFVILHTRPSIEDPPQSGLQRHVKIEEHIGFPGEAVEFSNPSPIAPAHGITRKSRIDVPVGQYDVSRIQQRKNLSFVAVGKIGTVDQRERRGGQELPLLSLS